jgi:hypothetical protein
MVFIKKCNWNDNQQEESGGLEILVAMLWDSVSHCLSEYVHGTKLWQEPFFCLWCLLLVCWQLRNFITQARVSMIVSCYDWNCAHQPLRSQNLCTKFQHFLLLCLFFTGHTIFRCCVRAFSIASWRAQLGTHQHHWNGPELCEQVTASTCSFLVLNLATMIR